MEPSSEVPAPWLCHPICSWLGHRTSALQVIKLLARVLVALVGIFLSPPASPSLHVLPSPCQCPIVPCRAPSLGLLVSVETTCVPIPQTHLSWASVCLPRPDRSFCSKDPTPMCCAARGRQLRVTPTLPSSGRHLEGLRTELEPSYLGVDWMWDMWDMAHWVVAPAVGACFEPRRWGNGWVSGPEQKRELVRES